MRNDNLNKSKILIVIVSTNDGKWLNDCFNSIANSYFTDFNTLVIVNKCSDITEDTIAMSPIPVTVIHTNKTIGFAEANNIGLIFAINQSYEYIFLLNPDTKIHVDTISHLSNFLDDFPEYGIVGSQQFIYDEEQWNTPNQWTRETISHAISLGHIIRDMGQWSIIDHFYVQGSALMLRTCLLPVIGFLDPVYETFYEETDFCRRCLFSGYKVALVLDSKIKHYGGGNWKKQKENHLKRDFLFLRNQFIFFVSGEEKQFNMIRVSSRIMYQQIKEILQRQQEIILPIWKYPRVIFDVLRHRRAILALQLRNTKIRQGMPIETTEYTIRYQ